MATDGGFTPDGAFPPLPTLSLAPIEGLFRHRVFKMLQRKELPTPERVKLMQTWRHSGFNVNASVRIGADDATGRESLALPDPRPFPVCPDCGGAMRIAFIEDQRVVRASPEHLSLWDEPRPPPALPAARHAPTELEYLPRVK